jgi:choline dehydrogenase-like flavoprotein
MHADPARGVTDAHCRVHSVRNLYISGGSLFPTGGHANPTLTVVALAIRLADHLKGLYGASGV